MKSLTLALCVVAILGSAASTFFYFQIGNTKEKLQQEVATAQSRSTQLEGRLTESTAQAEVLQKRLAELDTDLGDAKSKTTAADGRNAQLARDVALVRSQLTAKTEAEQTLSREIASLKREIAQAKLAESSSSPEEINGYKSTIAALEAKVTALSSGRSISEVAGVGGTVQPAGAAAGTSGTVVSIGDKNSFVVLDIGTAQGVQANQRVNVLRKGATVATAVVSSVQADFSIAQVNAGSVVGGLLKGDSAAIAQ